MGSVEVIVFPRDYEANRNLFVEDSKLFIRGRVSLGDGPAGKLVCEQVLPFSEASGIYGFSLGIWRPTAGMKKSSWGC